MRPVLLFRMACVLAAAGCSTSPEASLGGVNCEIPQGTDLGNPVADAGLVAPACSAAPCTDFQAPAGELQEGKKSDAAPVGLSELRPILDGDVPANPGARFGPAGAFTTSLCVAEPQLSETRSGMTLPGALYPANWARPRFRMKPANGEDLFEIRIEVPSEVGELVVYTTNLIWKMPADLWQHLGVLGHAVDQDITVTIRGVNTASPGAVSGARGTFRIAPVTVAGSVVYRAAKSADVSLTSSKLSGFYVGGEIAVDVLTLPQVQQSGIESETGMGLRGSGSNGYQIDAGAVECIGCHTSTPDGTAVGFTDAWPWDNVFADIGAGSVGQVPAWLSPSAQQLLLQPWLGMMTMSPARFRQGDRTALTTYEARDAGVAYVPDKPDTHGESGKDRLAWFDLETDAGVAATSDGGINAAIAAVEGRAWGFLTLDGEDAGVISPSWSHDGTTIAYTSATQTQDGRIGDDAETDIHLVPYNGRDGGTVTALAGAATAGVSEYYPAFSADDKFIAFNRAGNTIGKIYYRLDGEVFMIPSAGGTAKHLAANDPPSCTGEASPGIINSWPRWSPDVVVDPRTGNTYYWLIFSSARDYTCSFRVAPTPYSPKDTRSSQLYIAGVMIDPAGNITSYPAVYLWNQDPTTSNLTPAWDALQIPRRVP